MIKRYNIASEGRNRTPVAIVAGKGAENSLHVCWMLHDLCNFHCSYCSESNWGGKDRGLKFEDAVFFMTSVFAQNRGKRFHVSFTGGEPTLWPDFKRFCEFLYGKGCELGLTTNGSRPAAYWDGLADWLTWTCVSYHAEFAKDDELLKTIVALAPRTRLAIRVMMNPERRFWEKAIEFAEKIKALSPELPLFVEYVPLQKNFPAEKEALEYEPWQKDFFRQNNHFTQGAPSPEVVERLARKRDVWDYDVIYGDGAREFCRPNQLVACDQVNFKGWSCEIGREQLFVGPQGEVFRAGCGVGGVLGKVSDGFVICPKAPVICDRDACYCGTDILVTKSAPKGDT